MTMCTKKILAGALMASALMSASGAAHAKRCLFVSSYHRGYAWSDGVERGLRSVLEGRCELKQFDMDTKRRKSETDKMHAAAEAKRLIETWQPDVVITADDNAAKYLIQPFYRDASVPVVFAGVNWTASEYGFPYRNVTGMVEVAPIRPMLETAMRTVGTDGRAFYLGADTLTERKNLKRFEDAARDLGLVLESRLVAGADAWISAYVDAQQRDGFLILGSHSGIADWDQARERVLAAVSTQSHRLTVTNHGWMMPFAMLGMTKVPEEQGVWSAQAALAILDGTPPSDIPIVANRQWDMWVNDALVSAGALNLPDELRRKAKKMP